MVATQETLTQERVCLAEMFQEGYWTFGSHFWLCVKHPYMYNITAFLHKQVSTLETEFESLESHLICKSVLNADTAQLKLTVLVFPSQLPCYQAGSQ